MYFHLNHPIRYVRLVGPIIAIDDLTPRFTFLTLDDGSGAAIEVKIQRLDPAVSASVDCPSNTAVENVNVAAGLGVFDVVVDGRSLDIGTVVKAQHIGRESIHVEARTEYQPMLRGRSQPISRDDGRGREGWAIRLSRVV